jgi:hypothetical protein
MPVVLDKVSLSLDGVPTDTAYPDQGNVVAKNEQELSVGVSLRATPNMQERDRREGTLPAAVAYFRQGDRGILKGCLFYNKGRDKVEFEKALSF